MRALLSLVALAVVFLGLPPESRAAPGLPAEAQAYTTRVRPLLKTYCVGCHNADKREGGVDLTSITDETLALARRGLWKRARKRIDVGEMPPAEAKQLPRAERQLLVGWLAFAAEHIDCDPARRDPGPSLLRRLTRTEYNNTIRELLGLPFDAGAAVGMPEDGGAEGHFDNLAANLTFSAALMDKYFAAADKISDRIFSPGYPGDGARKRLFNLKPGPKLPEREAARQIVTGLVRRAYRKPAREQDIDRLMGFFDQALAKGETFETGVRAILKPILVSPQFLFRIEEDRPANGKSPGVLVDDHELAVRLSYFLWSTMPDEELFRLTSPDGMTWSAPLLGKEGETYRAVAVGAGRGVCVGSYGSGNIFAATRDGSAWKTDFKDGKYSRYVRGLGFGNGLFLAVGGDPGAVGVGNPFVLTSPDGEKWEGPTDIAGKFILRRVAFGNKMIVGVGDRGRRATSLDGLSWKDAAEVKAIDTLIDVAFGNGVFVGVGLHGLRLITADGLKWTDRQVGEEGEHLNAIVWADNRFVAVGAGATYVSPDGLKWERHPNSNAPLSVAFGNGVFVGPRWKGRLLRSADGIAWREVQRCEQHVEAVAFGKIG